jgi:glycosyltransferase involved in cell wall biosynthesis
MRILWASNAPWAPSGYGTQTTQVVRRLAADGHQVAIAANYGLHGSVRGDPNLPGVPILPMGNAEVGNDILPAHHAMWSEDGPALLLGLYDVWKYDAARFEGIPSAWWTPIDHDPVPPLVTAWAKGHPTIAMSRFGERALADAGVDAHYVPHAIETDVFRPGDKAAARTGMGWDQDAFYIVVNATAHGVPMRKSWDQLLDAVGRFMARHPLARLHLHSSQVGISGPDLRELCAAADIPPDRVSWAPSYAYLIGQIGPDHMATLYQAADVLLSPSKGEGFGIPVIEAQACGLPVIVSDFSAQPELVGGGWLVAGQREWDVVQRSWWFTPFTDGILARLEEAWDSVGDPYLREAAIAKAAEYDADRVYDERWRPLLPLLEQSLHETALRVAA